MSHLVGGKIYRWIIERKHVAALMSMEIEAKVQWVLSL